MKMKGMKNGGITISEKVLDDVMSTDDIGRALSLMARWAIRIARKKAINNRGTGMKIIILDTSNGSTREIGDK